MDSSPMTRMPTLHNTSQFRQQLHIYFIQLSSRFTQTIVTQGIWALLLQNAWSIMDKHQHCQTEGEEACYVQKLHIHGKDDKEYVLQLRQM
jgi:uncharacterized lipoprotein YmbA